jgi:7-keto-8-aminopelargonate synthetase-like enzyme
VAGGTAAGPAPLAAVEARLRAILEPYRDRLDEGTIYGIATLRRPDAKAHDWFAGVQLANGYVKLNFLPMHEHPELLDGVSPALRKRKTGASVFRFTDLDDELAAEVEALVARAYPIYVGEAS